MGNAIASHALDEFGDLVHEPEELVRTGRTSSSRVRLRRRSLGTLADDQEPQPRIVGRGRCEGVDEDVVALAGYQPRRDSDRDRVG